MTKCSLFTCVALAAGCFRTPAFSADQVSGILMTKMCSRAAVKGGQEVAAKHERTCNLKENCAKTGFGVFTADGKFIAFDDAGNSVARKALEASTRKDDMKVTVTGEIQGDSMKVADLKLAQ